MKRKFVVIGQYTPEEEQKFLDWVRSRGIGWWKRVPNTWLLVSKSTDPGLNATAIRDKLMEIRGPADTAVVLEVNSKDWSGYHAAREASPFAWLNDHWETD